MIEKYAEFLYDTEGLKLHGYKSTQIMNKVYMDTKKYMIIPILNLNIYNQAKMILSNSNTRNNFVFGYLKYEIKLPEKQQDHDLKINEETVQAEKHVSEEEYKEKQNFRANVCFKNGVTHMVNGYAGYQLAELWKDKNNKFVKYRYPVYGSEFEEIDIRSIMKIETWVEK